jgi:hypothetical protein
MAALFPRAEYSIKSGPVNSPAGFLVIRTKPSESAVKIMRLRWHNIKLCVKPVDDSGVDRAVEFPSEWRGAIRASRCEHDVPSMQTGASAVSCSRERNAGAVDCRIPQRIEHAILASSRGQKRFSWTCSTLSAVSKLSVGAVQAVSAWAHGLNSATLLQHGPIGEAPCTP